MKRQHPHWANPESDQSISDEEEEEFGHDCVSLAASVHKEEGSEILSRLVLLRGNYEGGNEDSDLSRSKQVIPKVEDDVEMPDFFDNDAIAEDEGKHVRLKDSCPDQAKKFPSEGGQDPLNSWSFASKEADALSHMTKHSLSHSKQKKPSKGAKGKGKPKFSFRFQSRREQPSSPSTLKDENNLAISKVPETLAAFEPGSELLEEIQNDEEIFPELMHCEAETLQSKSMAELLDGLQDTSSLSRENSRKTRNKRGKQIQIDVKSIEVSPDDVDCCEPSSDSEMNDYAIELAIPDMKRKTIVDQFQEAFGATFANDNMGALPSLSKEPRGGLFWRLQQVMQLEKEREMDFLEKKGNEAFQNERSCIYVKLLSKHLEAKLTVCHCFVSDYLEGLQCDSENKGSRKTIIFNPRVSVDVDLEVGNCIQIYAPWKEVKVRNDDGIILAAYFSNC